MQGAYNSFDARHQLVSQVRETFSTEIASRKTSLGTYYDSVALIDLAKERLASGSFTPSEPDWALVIRNVLLGWGFNDGIIDTSKLKRNGGVIEMTYSKRRFGAELILELEKGFDPARIAIWSDKVHHDHIGETDNEVDKLMFSISLMNEDQFEISKDQLQKIAIDCINAP